MPAEITVQIEIDEKGQISVGAVPQEAEQAGPDAGGAPPAATSAQDQAAALMGGSQGQGQPGASPAGEEGQEADYMQPVKSIDEALAMAKQLLTQGAGPSQDDQMAQGFGGGGGPTAMMNRRPVGQ